MVIEQCKTLVGWLETNIYIGSAVLKSAADFEHLLQIAEIGLCVFSFVTHININILVYKYKLSDRVVYTVA